MDTEKKLFAFKLAEKQASNADENGRKWKAREGVAIAGCTNHNGALWLATPQTGDIAPDCN
jgi:hypothetical protein